MLGSFRDPSGFVFTDEAGILYRQINGVYESDFKQLHESGLYDNLTAEGLLVRHEDAGLDHRQSDDAVKVIRPEMLPFVSYPYEWCFSQLQDAALLTLDIQSRALDHDMSLKDASAYNVMFKGARPVFIDTLSFEPYSDGHAWIAYRQFCRHFLAPLSLMAYRDIRLIDLLRRNLDGVPLELASRLLPRRTWLSPGLAIHLHLHAKAEQRSLAQGRNSSSADAKEAKVSLQGLRGILDSLATIIGKLHVQPELSAWSDYYADNTYSEGAAKSKAGVVGDFLERVSPASVWDLGANTGRYSEVARAHADCVVAMEQDPWCVEAAYRKWKDEECDILPLVIDLSNPSPALGWAHVERQSLVERGPVDAVLALALIHHLCIANNVPLQDAAAFFASIAEHLIIEFVPKEDEMVQFLLASREDIFPDYTQAGFEDAFKSVFEIVAQRPSENADRTTYLMKRK